MPTCSFRAGTSRYWPWRVRGFLARDRRRDPRCRRARWRMRASSERLRASHHGRMVASSSVRSLVLRTIGALGLDKTILVAFPAWSLRGRLLRRRLLNGLAGMLPHAGVVEFAQEVLEPVRDALADNIVVHALEDVAEPA